jgi:transcriptional regulator with XRE-family HTH domain
VAQSLGKIIRAARKRAELPAAQVARRAELDPAYFSRIESGVVPNPPFATVVRIARALGLSLDELAGTAAEKPAARKRATDEVRRDHALQIIHADLERVADRIARLRDQQ